MQITLVLPYIANHPFYTHISFLAIPTSNFSSESGTNRRPPRRSQHEKSNTDTDDWFNDYESGSNQQNSRSSRSGGSSSSNGWDVVDDNDWSTDNSSGSSASKYEPYTYDALSTNNRGRGRGSGINRNRDGGERNSNNRSRGGWDDRRSRGGRGRDQGGRGRGGRGRGRGGDKNRRNISDTDKDGSVKVNLKLIEAAGYQHLYGIAPVLNALKANVRDFTNPEIEENEDLEELNSRLASVDGIDNDDDDISNDRWDNEYDDEDDNRNSETKRKKIIKPEAQTKPHLFVQETTLENNKRSFRSNAKVEASNEIVSLAKQYELPIVEVDKGMLNTLCGNRPHQGFVLRCGGRDFTPIKRLPIDNKSGPKIWLALDEVVDPQNLGALLRSSYFLGRGAGTLTDDDEDDIGLGGDVGIIVCSKNSSPLSPTVSAASAGALEFMTVYSTSNLPKLLNSANEDGWHILGAAADVPDNRGRESNKNGELALGLDDTGWDLGEDDDEVKDEEKEDSNDNTKQQQQHHELHKVDASSSPTILVLGSEGRGLRTLVARACTGFVSVPGGSVGGGGDDDDDDNTQAGVDSLNVSVTGGILLWHFLSG